jgi:hypothetical protein
MHLGDNPHSSFYNFLLSPHWVHIVYFEGRYFYQILLQVGAIDWLPHLLVIWCDPKANNFIIRKNILKDWLSSYLLDCKWYLDYPKDCITTSKVAFHKKIEPKFQFILQASITIHIKASKKKGKRKGKEHIK